MEIFSCIERWRIGREDVCEVVCEDDLVGGGVLLEDDEPAPVG